MILKRCQYMLYFPCSIFSLRTNQKEWPDNTKKVPIYVIFCYFVICVFKSYICIRTALVFLTIIHVHLYVTKRVSIQILYFGRPYIFLYSPYFVYMINIYLSVYMSYGYMHVYVYVRVCVCLCVRVYMCIYMSYIYIFCVCILKGRVPVGKGGGG